MQVSTENGIWGVLAAAVGSVATYFATRPRPKTKHEHNLDAVEVLSEALDQLRIENERLIGVANSVRTEGHRLRNELMKWRGYIQTRLGPYIAEMQARLRAAGIEPPPMPPPPDFGETASPGPEFGDAA